MEANQQPPAECGSDRRTRAGRAKPAGADVFLFTRSLDEDFGFMMDGVAEGTISPARLDAAVARILGLKAALKLHECPARTLEAAQAIVGSAEHQAWSKECADKAITLVKEEKGVLPLTPEKYKKILFVPIEAGEGVGYGVRQGACEVMRGKLVDEGFDVDIFKAKNVFEGEVDKTSNFIGVYDAIVYVANILERIGLGSYFDAISDGTNITRSKPDSEVFLKAAEYVGVEPAKCVVVGDAVAGIDVAHAAGMYGVAMGDAADQGAGDAKLRTFADLATVMTDLGC